MSIVWMIWQRTGEKLGPNPVAVWHNWSVCLSYRGGPISEAGRQPFAQFVSPGAAKLSLFSAMGKCDGTVPSFFHPSFPPSFAPPLSRLFWSVPGISTSRTWFCDEGGRRGGAARIGCASATLHCQTGCAGHGKAGRAGSVGERVERFSIRAECVRVHE